MKWIANATNAAEAHLLAETLRQEGIAASVQGQWGAHATPSVWIDDNADLERARALLAEMLSKHRPAPPAPPAQHRFRIFAGGVAVGLLFAIIIAGLVGDKRASARSPATWDTNGDGKADGWGRYDADGRLISASDDRNFDGVADAWQSYDPPGVLSAAKYDDDFDGREDLWEVIRNGITVSYTADNDRNGVVDEWGRDEHGRIAERNWSFANDRVADKRAIYQFGQKVREQFDRNRDGVFEETVLFDEFERQVTR